MSEWWQFKKRSRCPHRQLRGIFGDEIIFATPFYSRLQCLECGKYLDGPVSLAHNSCLEATE
jgi:hypothetical protein